MMIGPASVTPWVKCGFSQETERAPGTSNRPRTRYTVGREAAIIVRLTRCSWTEAWTAVPHSAPMTARVAASSAINS